MKNFLISVYAILEMSWTRLWLFGKCEKLQASKKKNHFHHMLLEETQNSLISHLYT